MLTLYRRQRTQDVMIWKIFIMEMFGVSFRLTLVFFQPKRLRDDKSTYFIIILKIKLITLYYTYRQFINYKFNSKFNPEILRGLTCQTMFPQKTRSQNNKK